MGNLCLKDILDDFYEKFSSKKCRIKTNYSKLSEFVVVFNVLDLHHLLGLHKVTRLKASESIEKVKKEELTIESLINHSRYSDIKARLANYKFLEEVFYKSVIEVCILEKDIQHKTSMELSVVFFKKETNKYIVLGLRKNLKTNTYHLATLHETRNDKYSSYKKTKFKIVEWI